MPGPTFPAFRVLSLALLGLVLASLAVALGLGWRRRAHEAGAADALRTISAAEADFHANDLDRNGRRDYWTGDVAGLHLLVPLVDGKPQAPDPALALKRIPARLAAADGGFDTPPTYSSSLRLAPSESTGAFVPHRGYVYRNSSEPRASHHPERYEIEAWPVTLGSGRRMHRISRDGAVRTVELGTGYVLEFEGWGSYGPTSLKVSGVEPVVR